MKGEKYSMIILKVKDYCQQCLEFEPDVQKPTAVCIDNERRLIGDTIITCEHSDRCEQIKNYLEVKNNAK